MHNADGLRIGENFYSTVSITTTMNDGLLVGMGKEKRVR